MDIANKALVAGIFASGVEIDYMSNEEEIYISVPKTSEMTHKDGEMLAGDKLAKRTKEMLEEALHHNVKVHYKIRNEHWTNQKYDQKFREEFNNLGGF